MKVLIACLTYVVLLKSANAQVNLPGHCPGVTVQKDFDLNMFMGTWHLQSSYPIVDRKQGKPDNPGNHACSVNFSKLENNTIIVTRNPDYNNALDEVSAHTNYLGDDQFKLQISSQNSTISLVYSILATDYKNYAVRYICRDLGDNHEIFIDIATRKPNPCDEVMKSARAEIAEKKLPLEHLTVTRSKGCDIEIDTSKEE